MENKENLLEKEHAIKENRIWVRISSVCNNKCIFCLDSDAHNGYFIDEEAVKKNIDEGFKPGMYNRVILSGGEASINPDFPKYIKYAKEKGYDRVQTVTNGNMFGNLEFCKKVFDAGLDEVTFSMHGHTPKLHDYLVDTKGAFKKSIRGILNIRKFFPSVILNIDIVVNKLNVNYLPKIVTFYMKLGIFEFDILQIVPFGRGFKEHKNELFYKISDSLEPLQQTWEISKMPGVNMWTNRFHAEAFEGYEDLIQDPRKIKSDTMTEGFDMYNEYYLHGERPECYGSRCDVCFIEQFCHNIEHRGEKSKLTKKILDGTKVENVDEDVLVLRGEEFPSDIYEKYGEKADFISYLKEVAKSEKALYNVPPCLSGREEFYYERYNEIKGDNSLNDFVWKYILNLYRKKSTRCVGCKFNDKCEGIHINFARSYGFDILNPIKGKK